MSDAVNDVDSVAGKLGLGDVDLSFDDGLYTEGEVGHGDAFFDTVVDAVNVAIVIPGEMKDGLAHGLGGNGAGIDADPTDDGAGFNHRDALSHFGGGDGGTLSGWPGTDDDEVVFGGTHVRVSIGDGPAKTNRRVEVYQPAR
jgi:hypothetical protein